MRASNSFLRIGLEGLESLEGLDDDSDYFGRLSLT